MFWKSHDAQFYQFFLDHITASAKAAKQLHRLFEKPAELPEQIERIVEAEHDADAIARNCHELIDRTFITKIDKGDIGTLIHELDHVIDFIKAAAIRLRLYHCTQIRREALAFSGVILRMTELLQKMVAGLPALKLAATVRQVVALKELEEQADHILHAALGKLFAEETDAKLVVAWKDIFEQLENVTDHCEDVAHIIGSIVRKETV